ncbi:MULTISPECIES: hypothetical protein [Alphaproteobacteria]|uniref:hypothetical protein n=1 Tax=Alphaproteobacteria TaxID=28211 RepID=UPI0032635624
MLNLIPETFAALSVPIPAKGKADQAAHNSAAALLQTDMIAMIHTVADGKVHSLFARSIDFPQDPAENEIGTSLAWALPGHPKHIGDGVYISDNGLAAVRTVANDVVSYSGEKSLVRAWAEDQGLPIHELPEGGGGRWLLPNYEREQRDGRTFIAVILCALAFTMFSVTNFSNAVRKSDQTASRSDRLRSISRTYETRMRGEIEKVSSQPALTVIGRLYDLGRVFKSTGSAITLFKVSDGNITWSADIPDWVDNATIESFGNEVSRTRLSETKQIRITASELIR